MKVSFCITQVVYFLNMHLYIYSHVISKYSIFCYFITETTVAVREQTVVSTKFALLMLFCKLEISRNT